MSLLSFVSHDLGTLEEIRCEDGLNSFILKILKKLGNVVISAYFCCTPLPQAVLIVLKENVNV